MSDQQVWPPPPNTCRVILDDPTRQERLRRLALRWSAVGCIVGVVAWLLDANVLWVFYQNAYFLAKLGKPVRLFGEAMAIATVTVGAFFLGVLPAVIGLIYSAKGKSRRGAVLGLTGIGLCLAAFPFSSAIFQWIADVRGVWLEP